MPNSFKEVAYYERVRKQHKDHRIESESPLANHDSIVLMETDDPEGQQHTDTWARMETLVPDTTIPWAELPGAVYGTDIDQSGSLHDRLVEIENENIRVLCQFDESKKMFANTTAGINTALQTESNTVKVANTMKQLEELAVDFERADHRNKNSSSEMYEEMDKLKTQNTTLSAKLDTMASQIATLVKHNETGAGKFAKFQAEHADQIAKLRTEKNKLSRRVHTLNDDVVMLKKENRKFKEALDKKMENKDVGTIRKLETENETLSDTVAKLTTRIGTLENTAENLRKKSVVNIENYRKTDRMLRECVQANQKHEENMAKQEVHWKKDIKMAKTETDKSYTNCLIEHSNHSADITNLTRQLEALEANTHQTDKLVNALMALPTIMKKSDTIVEDTCYVLPMYWSCQLEEGSSSRSQRFYLCDGYRLEFHGGWSPDESVFKVGVRLMKGRNDGRAGMWPWRGHMELLIRDRNDGVVLGNYAGGTVSGRGWDPPSDDLNGNGYYLLWKKLPLDKDQTVIDITLSRK